MVEGLINLQPSAIFMTSAFRARVSKVGACLAAAVCVTGNADTGTAAAPGSPQSGASAPDSPLRAFWREPDYVTLMAAGHYLEATRLPARQDRKSTRLNSSHPSISYAVF